VTVPANALVSSAMFLSGPPTLNASEISTGARPEVRFTNVPVWDMRPVQTLEVVHPFGQQTGRAMPIDAQLRLSQGRLRGQLVNPTARTVRSLQVVSPSGAQASLAAALEPGATAAVDVQLTQGVPGLPPGKGPAPPGMQGFVPPQSPDEALVALAASQAASRVDDLALVALTEPLDVPWIEGVRPTRSGRAVMVEPVWLESADSLARLTPSARLVGSGAAGDGGQVDAYEVDLPGGLTGRLALKVAIAPGSQATAYSVEVYDWRLRGWRPVTGQAALAAGETAPGVVRLRVREDSVGQVQMSVTALP